MTDPATGSTAAPMTGPLFRFFDQTSGTHFFSASVAERDGLLVNNQNLVEETNGFGVVENAGGNSVSVYRFFDTVHGTHFYTASSAERDQVLAGRPDLTYEASGNFLEYASASSGGTPVYRLFSTADGTHFFTSNSAELAGLTTPGSAGYRPDLVSEGIGFYAPAGSFT